MLYGYNINKMTEPVLVTISTNTFASFEQQLITTPTELVTTGPTMITTSAASRIIIIPTKKRVISKAVLNDLPDILDSFLYDNDPFKVPIFDSEIVLVQNNPFEDIDLTEINMDPQILPVGHHIVIPAKDIDNNYTRDLDTPYQNIINAINNIDKCT